MAARRVLYSILTIEPDPYMQVHIYLVSRFRGTQDVSRATSSVTDGKDHFINIVSNPTLLLASKMRLPY